MTGKPRKPSEEQVTEAPQPKQQMQDDGSQSFGENSSEIPEDDGTSFANINP